MDCPPKLLPDDVTSVGVFKKGDAYEVRIITATLAGDIDEVFGNECKLVFCRPFNDVLMAIAYRDMLKKLPDSSLKAIVEIENPEEKDLREKIY